jgi:SAM-dependent methyltransferase
LVVQAEERDIMNGQSQSEQAALWNGRAGQAWVETQELLDAMLEPFERHLLQAVAADSPRSLLDVGCGTGSTTLAVARLLGEGGHGVGVDISEPMLAVARRRASAEGSRATFVCADAQTHAFGPRSFEVIMSRFGVMFFDDPVAAFGNLSRAATSGGKLRFVAWRSPADNPFMTTAERTAAPLLPDLPPRKPHAPGQFAFADQQRVVGILEQSGWLEIDVQPLDVTCTLPERGLVQYFTRLGPLALALQDADDATRAKVVDTVRAAFEPYVHGAEVRFNAACWSIGARAA